MSAKPKSSKSPKLTKKERAELARQQAIEAEQEALRLAELERQRLDNEHKENIKRAKNDTIEQNERIKQLVETLAILQHVHALNTAANRQKQHDLDWNLYVNVGRLPNPIKPAMMTTYLHLWQQTIDDTMMEEVAARTKDVLFLLNDLDYRIYCDSDGSNNEFIGNLKWLRHLFRNKQQQMLNIATYNRLRDINKYFNQLDLIVADYQYVDGIDGNLMVDLWLQLNQPKSLPNPRKLQQQIKSKQTIDFADMKLHLQFPDRFDFENKVVRAMYLKYDHLSDSCATYHQKTVRNDNNLLDLVKFEWNHRLKTMPKFDIDEKIAPIGEYIEVIARKFDRIDYSINLSTPDEINLRKYRLLGGIYYIELIEQPPQPRKFVHLTMTTTTLQIPKQLKMVDFFIKCQLPKLPEPTGGEASTIALAPEIIEAHLKKLEQEFEKLILVTLIWPSHVHYFELPIICQWDPKRQIWTKENIFDVKPNEEKCQLTFRTGRFGVFGLATYRYANLPYQAWEIFPENDGSVTIQITCAIVLIEFNVKDDGGIALVLFQNSPNYHIMEDLIGVRMELPQLILLMQERGVDIFPDRDAICYIEGACEKRWEMERHLYFNMAQLSLFYNFAWSRWNLTGGYQQIILQIREYILDKLNVKRNMKKFKPLKQRQYKMLLVTTNYARYVNCTEVSQNWNNQSIDNGNVKFSADLWNLIQSTTNNIKKDKINKTPYQLICTIDQLLQRTRICSFS